MRETYLSTDQSSVWSRIPAMPPTEACHVNSVTHRQCKWIAISHEREVACLSVITKSLSWLAPSHSLADLMSGYFNPASGYLNNGNGTLNNVGSNGNYWSASPNGQNGYNLNFNSSNVNPSNNNNRANGFPVRCVQEFARCQKVSAHVLVF